ncbi:hypothetical protein GPJ56_008141 [Histomonas meleagridis]|nr:hypothetical protein GPJ56_008141 [Histomonas meleagridis]
MENEVKTKNEYRKLLKEYRNKLNQITDIHYERDVIYREAERTMLQILEGQKLIGEIKERENPHQKEIAAGKSLITYLEGMQGHPQHKENKQQQNVQHTKRSNKEAEKLIASLKKDKNNNKNKNQRQKKNNMKNSN